MATLVAKAKEATTAAALAMILRFLTASDTWTTHRSRAKCGNLESRKIWYLTPVRNTLSSNGFITALFSQQIHSDESPSRRT